MRTLLSIAVGGALGALARYKTSSVVYRAAGGTFPWGTLAVNLTGCFIIGFLWGFSEELVFPPEARSMVFIGFIGSFTTFSTYALEVFNLLKDGEFTWAFLNMMVSNVVGVIMVLAGFVLSKYIMVKAKGR